jgi:hypothetical protein
MLQALAGLCTIELLNLANIAKVFEEKQMKIEFDLDEETVKEEIEKKLQPMIRDGLNAWGFSSQIKENIGAKLRSVANEKIEALSCDSDFIQKLVVASYKEAIYKKVTAQVRKMELTPEMMQKIIAENGGEGA